VKTSSGATAVQIARKHHGVRTIIDHIGSAHDDAQLAVLMQIAKERIAAGQLAFDLDGLTSGSSMTAAPTVAGSTSRVLWEVLEGAYARLGFDSVDDDVSRSLMLARVVEPTSKADTIRVLGELGVPTPSLRTIWRTIARCVEHDWRDTVSRAAYAHATKGGSLSLVLYDVTTLYFEAEDEDDLRKVGMSKERRVDPQIVVGLLVTPNGFPLEVHAFTGNTAETTTLIPVLRSFQDRHGVKDIVVAADAGMLSAGNLNALEDQQSPLRPGGTLHPRGRPPRWSHPGVETDHGCRGKCQGSTGGLPLLRETRPARQPHPRQADRTRAEGRRWFPAREEGPVRETHWYRARH